MKYIILCEGKTDAILLSYYLLKTLGWRFSGNACKSLISGPSMRSVENESLNWYQRDSNFLCIWGIGGNDFRVPFEDVMGFNQYDSEGFSKILIMTDRDRHAKPEDLLQILNASLVSPDYAGALAVEQWSLLTYVNKFQQQCQLEWVALILPMDRTGAMETFLLTALSDRNTEDDRIVNLAKRFVDDLNSAVYLTTNRLQIKAHLAVTLAIMYPERTFSLIDELIQSIPWEDYARIQSGFNILHAL